MEITTATLRHLDPLARLFDAYRVFYRRESDLPAARAFLSQRLDRSDSVIYVAEEPTAGALAGFVQLYPLFSSTRMQRLWLLNDLYVAPSYRRQGIGHRLIDRSKELARATQAAGLMLETEKSNAIGNQLYPVAGFALDTEHNYYFWAPAG